MTPIYAVGDIHGNPEMLLILLDLIAADAKSSGIDRAKTVFMGDSVDRGPDSRRVLDILSSPEIRLRFDCVFLAGNHDLVMLANVRNAGEGTYDHALASEWLFHGGAETVESYGVVIGSRTPKAFLSDMARAVPPRHMAFLASLERSWTAPGLFFAHGGVDPDRPLADQTAQDLCYGGGAAMFEHDHEWLGPKMRERLGARIVHGHFVSKTVDVWPHRIGVDTGAGYWGGRLSAAAIEGEEVRVLTAG